MSELFIKSSDGFQVNKFDVQKGELEAVVTSFKNYDVVNDRIFPGALDKFLKQFDGGLQMLYQHSKNEIIGQWNSFEIRGDLVIGKGEIYPEVSRGRDAIALISRGMIGSTSIGFRAGDYQGNDKGGFDFKEIDLVEVSLVKTPANPKAAITSAKNEDGTLNVKNLEKLLREAGLSRKESKELINGGACELREAIRNELHKDNLLAKLKSEIGGITNV